MNVVDRGRGVPVVLLPGIQGRWEWHAPAIDALAASCRVISFSFADEPSSKGDLRDEPCLDAYCRQIEQAMAQAGVERAVLCGVSYGGLVAAVFSARRPERVLALTLVSALPPTWVPDARVRTYLRAPFLCLPLFLLQSTRMLGEIRAASTGPVQLVRFCTAQGWHAVVHPSSPARMARRAAQLEPAPLTSQVRTISAPTLVLVGEHGLDCAVPVPMTLQYLKLIPHATMATLARTGHLGSVTKPHEFAAVVAAFAARHAAPPEEREHID